MTTGGGGGVGGALPRSARKLFYQSDPTAQRVTQAGDELFFPPAPETITPPEPAPAAKPIPGREEYLARQKRRRTRGRGRRGNILGGLLGGDTLDTGLGG